MGANVCEIIILDVCYYFFLVYYFVVLYKHHIVRILHFIGKEWFYGFPEFFGVRNTFDIFFEIFLFGLAECFNTKIPLFLIVVPVFVRPLYFLGTMPGKWSDLSMFGNLIYVLAQFQIFLVKSPVITVEHFFRITFTYSVS